MNSATVNFSLSYPRLKKEWQELMYNEGNKQYIDQVKVAKKNVCQCQFNSELS